MRRAPRFRQDDLFRCRGCGGWRIRPRRGLADPCPTCRVRAMREHITALLEVPRG